MAQLVQFFEKIPPLILIGSVSLIVVAAYMLSKMLLEAHRLKAQLASLRGAWQSIALPKTEDRAAGLNTQILGSIQSKCSHLQGIAGDWWREVDESLERYTSPEERDGWFLVKPLREVLPDTIMGSHFHRNLYVSFPGILTGIGLMLTFLAILLALANVSYDKANAVEPVSGMEGLINGLSGKFLSSIIALLLSVFFTLVEKDTVRRLRNCYDTLILTGGNLFPYLSPSRVLLDIQRFASKQTVSVSHISSEVVDRFVGAFQKEISPALAEGVSAGMAGKLQDEFRPTMQRMNETLEELRTAIVGLEAQKQQSVETELRSLLESLEISMVNALRSMGTQFQDALSGAAAGQFGNIQSTLEGTRQMLAEMNTQFASMQAAFAGVIQKAEESTNSQIATGRQQTEAQVRLMEGLMLKLQETANQNVTDIRSELTMVVTDLAQRVGALSEDLMTAAQKVSRESQSSAQQVVEQAGNWSEATAKRLEALLNSIEMRSSEFQAAGQTLVRLQTSLQETIKENRQILTNFAEASRQVQTYSTALAGQAGTLENLSKYQVQVTAQLKQTSASLDTAAHRNEEFLQQYQRVFEQYRKVFDDLDGRIGSTLSTIQRGMNQYTQSVENNFKEIVKTANQMLPDIAKRLEAQTGEIAEQIEELSDVLGKGLDRLNGRTR